MPPRPFFHRPPQYPPMRSNMMMRPMMPFQPNQPPFQRQRGGILSRLFGRNHMPVQQPVNPFQFHGARQGLNTQTGGSILQNMLNPESLTRFLNQTQQVLKTVQSIGPMVQQYGPLIKNLPALWKLYRNLSNSDDNNDDNEGSDNSDSNENEETKRDTKEETDNLSESKRENEESVQHKKRHKKKQTSGPKLYI